AVYCRNSSDNNYRHHSCRRSRIPRFALRQYIVQDTDVDSSLYRYSIATFYSRAYTRGDIPGGIIPGPYLITLSTSNGIKGKIVASEYWRFQYPSCFNRFPVYHFPDPYHRDDCDHTTNVIRERS